MENWRLKEGLTRIRTRSSTILFFLFVATSIATPVSAGVSPSYTQGVALYNSNRYADARPHLEKAVREKPYDSSSHYYLALCYQATRQNALARQHFQWVANSSTDPVLKGYANNALKHFSGSQSTTSSSAPSQTQTNGNSSFQAQAAVNPANPAVGGQPKVYGRCKVLMFETSWCHYCHEFAPTFDDTANRYRSYMDFQRINAEEQTDLRDKYGIHSYPRLVYLDEKGGVIYNEGRGAFQRRVKELTGK